MKTVSLLAPAKINLYLNVAGKRPNGYHDIETVMQSVSLFDRLQITVHDAPASKQIALSCFGLPIVTKTDADNLIYRAAVAFFEAMDIPHYNIELSLEKQIPTEAGLGGGSADAAATLLALDHLYKTRLSTEKLCEIGVKLGADIPFCIRRGTVRAEGIGDIMTAIAPMPHCALLIAMPKGGKVSTAEAYRKIDAIGPDADIPYADFLCAMEHGDIHEIASKLYNKFELVTPEETGSLALVRMMQSLGALGVRMSGSGASVFGIFADEPAAKAAFDALPADMQKFICRPISSEFSLI